MVGGYSHLGTRNDCASVGLLEAECPQRRVLAWPLWDVLNCNTTLDPSLLLRPADTQFIFLQLNISKFKKYFLTPLASCKISLLLPLWHLPVKLMHLDLLSKCQAHNKYSIHVNCFDSYCSCLLLCLLCAKHFTSILYVRKLRGRVQVICQSSQS